MVTKREMDRWASERKTAEYAIRRGWIKLPEAPPKQAKEPNLQEHSKVGQLRTIAMNYPGQFITSKELCALVPGTTIKDAQTALGNLVHHGKMEVKEKTKIGYIYAKL